MTSTISGDATANTLAAVARFNAAFERRDMEGLRANLTQDTVFENTSPAPDGERFQGIEDVVAFWGRFFRDNPNARFETEDEFAVGDRCLVRWRYYWPGGHVRGVDVFRVRDGKIAEKLAYVKG